MSAEPSRRADATTEVPPPGDRAVTGKSPIGARSPDPAGARAGDVVGGKYELVRVLGQGGMGAVWLAKNRALDADVAVKLIRREKATPAASARLLKEAQLAARLSHPSIVRIFDFGTTEDGDPYIVMELLRGESLADLVERKGRLPPVRAVQVILPVVAGLMAAHAKGVVHRDLKPDNIFLAEAPSGMTPKLVDFGIAKLSDDPIGGSLTQTGAVLGSPDYMSPEQARGRSRIDERTDVWGLAVVLYECVTGLAPFQGYNYNALLSAIIEDAPTSFAELGVRDAGLWAIVERGLQKKPEQRYQSARELGRALVEWLQERDVTTDITGAALASDWGAERRLLSEPLVAAPHDPAPESARSRSDGDADAALLHAAIPPPPRLPAAEGLALPTTDEAAPGDDSARASSSEVAAPPEHAAPAHGPAVGWRAGAAIALVALATGVGLTALAGRRRAPSVPPAAPALTASASPTSASPEPADSAAAPIASASTTVVPAASVTEPTSSAEPKSKAPARAPGGRPRKPGTMPLPAKPDF
jgi:serine/threonine-protein kinase